MRDRRPSEAISDDDITRVLKTRAAMEGYPLSSEDVGQHTALLIDLIREKISTLAGPTDGSPMTVVEALNHVLMTSRWMKRNLKA